MIDGKRVFLDKDGNPTSWKSKPVQLDENNKPIIDTNGKAVIAKERPTKPIITDRKGKPLRDKSGNLVEMKDGMHFN